MGVVPSAAAGDRSLGAAGRAAARLRRQVHPAGRHPQRQRQRWTARVRVGHRRRSGPRQDRPGGRAQGDAAGAARWDRTPPPPLLLLLLLLLLLPPLLLLLRRRRRRPLLTGARPACRRS
jgi:hypothetical protein